jgi:large subunit ribosomal protein L35
MPKMKTHSGAKKRFKVSKCGKVKHKKIGMRHLQTGMPADQGRKLRKTAILHEGDTKIIKKVMPYEW